MTNTYRLDKPNSCLVQMPGMEKPIHDNYYEPKSEQGNGWGMKFRNGDYTKDMLDYEQHLASLLTLPLLSIPAGWVDGQVVVEGKDFEIGYQVLEPVPDIGELEWVTRDKPEYDKYKDCQGGSVTRMIAIPPPQWRRYRFETKQVDDYRPLIFNPKYPWWCSGHGTVDMEAATSVIIAYLPVGEDLLKYWDDAFNIEFTEEAEIKFSGRFPKPEYFKS